MKRLSGWDAVLLYSETPNVHMHTLKVAVIELDSDRQEFGVDAFREVIAGRLHKLEPLGYQLVDVPLKFHHPMWREHCKVDLNYHIRPWRLRAPGGRRELDEAVGEIEGEPPAFGTGVDQPLGGLLATCRCGSLVPVVV